ncbi:MULTISPECIES: LysE family translocator [unclassified Pseudomonas]|uniref:LysE family translocator n=1 Tax=unclassified Pseudomonas TaxID=196821 RepID=UPI000A20106F|nr:MULTISPECIES: LysE family translocator [unclassified Pseudomonas]
MSASTLLGFWAFALVFVIVPGADWAYAISAGVRGQGVIPAVLGLLTGYTVLTVVVAAGLGVLVAANPSLLMGLSIAGALYLCWLGVGMLRSPPASIKADDATGALRGMDWYVKGTLVSGLNPKGLLFFVAFLPPWTSAQASWGIPAQLLALGLVYTASCSVIYTLVGLGAERTLRTRPDAARLIGRVSGVIMLVLAASLLYRELPMG